MDLEVLIVGGGIHGAGLLHDLASRGVKKVLLAERGRLAGGTSSRSTKLVHGGLRYLERLSEWPLVAEALRERTLLLRVLRGVVQPLPLVLPSYQGARPPWMVRAGLFLYDALAGDSGIPAARHLEEGELWDLAPYLAREALAPKLNGAFLFHDAQMIDDAIVRIACFAATKFGAAYEEGVEVTSLEEIEGGFRARLRSDSGERTLTARAVVNAAGAWNNANLLRWGFNPRVPCLLNLGTHLLFAGDAVDGNKKGMAGALLQNDDGRVLFFLPWQGMWMWGTTESVFHGDPRHVSPPAADRAYLLEAARKFLGIPDPEKALRQSFCGVRTMPLAGRRREIKVEAAWRTDPFSSPFYRHSIDSKLQKLSRETVIDETIPRLWNVYGGKYTTYRSQMARLGAKVCAALGTGGASQTSTDEAWFLRELVEEHPEIFRTDHALRSMDHASHSADAARSPDHASHGAVRS